MQAVLQDPVIAADGYTYEQSAAQHWLKHYKASPLTGAQLSHHRLVPNLAIRDLLAKPSVED